MSPERIQFIKHLEAGNYSPCTIKNYEQSLVNISQFHNKSPLAMTCLEIQRSRLKAKNQHLARHLHKSTCRTFQQYKNNTIFTVNNLFYFGQKYFYLGIYLTGVGTICSFYSC